MAECQCDRCKAIRQFMFKINMVDNSLYSFYVSKGICLYANYSDVRLDMDDLDQNLFLSIWENEE